MGERVGGFDGVRVGASVGDVGNYQDCYYELDRGGGLRISKINGSLSANKHTTSQMNLKSNRTIWLSF